MFDFLDDFFDFFVSEEEIKFLFDRKSFDVGIPFFFFTTYNTFDIFFVITHSKIWFSRSEKIKSMNLSIESNKIHAYGLAAGLPVTFLVV